MRLLMIGSCALPLASVACTPPAPAAEVPPPAIRTFAGEELSAERLDALLARQMDSLGIPGASVAIFSEGEVVYHRALGVSDLGTGAPVDDRTVFEAASLTKPVFAYLVMRMVERGVIDLDTPLHRYLPLDSLNRGWYAGIAPDERHEGITARTVLSHTTGLPNWRWDNDDGELDLKFAPGERFSYSGEGFEMLADVLAHRLGTDHQGLDSVFRAEVAAPLGMRLASISPDPELARRTASRHVDGEPGGNEWCCNGRDFMASGGLHTEALSYASFLLAFLRGEGITEEHRDEMLSSQVVLPPDASSREQDRVDTWGLGFAIRPSQHGPLLFHGGTNTGFRAAFLVDPESLTGYVLFTNSDRGGELHERLAALFIGG